MVFKGTVGVKISVNVTSDITGGSNFKIFYKKPDGTAGSWTATKGSDNKSVEYTTTAAGDLDQTGIWLLESYVEVGGYAGPGETATLEVHARVATQTYSFTYDPTTNLGKVRNMIGDSVDTGHVLDDADINGLLAVAGSDLYQAAGLCLYRIAASKALLAKKKSAGDYSEDLTAIAKEVRAVAAVYMEMSQNAPAEAQAESFFNDFSYRDVTVRKILRDENE
jgi:hypothetical protein